MKIHAQPPDSLNNFCESSANNFQSQILGVPSDQNLFPLSSNLNNWVVPNSDVLIVENDVVVGYDAWLSSGQLIRKSDPVVCKKYDKIMVSMDGHELAIEGHWDVAQSLSNPRTGWWMEA